MINSCMRFSVWLHWSLQIASQIFARLRYWKSLVFNASCWAAGTPRLLMSLFLSFSSVVSNGLSWQKQLKWLPRDFTTNEIRHFAGFFVMSFTLLTDCWVLENWKLFVELMKPTSQLLQYASTRFLPVRTFIRSSARFASNCWLLLWALRNMQNDCCEFRASCVFAFEKFFRSARYITAGLHKVFAQFFELFFTSTLLGDLSMFQQRTERFWNVLKTFLTHVLCQRERLKACSIVLKLRAPVTDDALLCTNIFHFLSNPNWSLLHKTATWST